MERHTLRRLKDFALYISISALVLAVIIVAADRRWGSFFNWFQFVEFSSVLFGYFIARCRQLWRRPAFWTLTGIFLLAHSIAFAFVLTRVDKFKPIWFAMVVPVELLGFVAVEDWFFVRAPRHHKATNRL